VIPVFGFHDREYHRLDEVRVHPESSGQDDQTTGSADESMMCTVGLRQVYGMLRKMIRQGTASLMKQPLAEKQES
jgi:hypothetical protein